MEPLDRRDDWRHGVDENLASLNAGQRVWDRENDLFRKEVGELRHLLLGDAQKETDGFMARLHQTENQINLFKAILLKDATGGKGLVGRVEVLESGERTSDNRWKFATAIVVAALSLSGLLATNWDRIGVFFSKKSDDPVDKMIERAKHPRGRHRHVVVSQERPEPAETSGEN